MESIKKVAILILNWNGLEDTLACLSSLYTSRDVKFDVIVIDNNSTSDELTIIKNCFQDIIPIQSPKNLGFTGGCNLGIKIALEKKADYIWLLNNDAIVFPDTLLSLVNLLQNELSIGMITPVTYDKAFTNILNCGATIDFDSLIINEISDFKETYDVEGDLTNKLCLWGAALLIRREVLEQIGAFDDRFFAYYEDYDYSLRVLKGGWKNSVDLHSMVLHGSKNRKRGLYFPYYLTRNEYLFLVKHSSLRNKKKNIHRFIAKTIYKVARLKEKGNLDEAKVMLDGLWDAMTKKYGEWNYQNNMPKIIKDFILWHPFIWGRLVSLFISKADHHSK